MNSNADNNNTRDGGQQQQIYYDTSGRELYLPLYSLQATTAVPVSSPGIANTRLPVLPSHPYRLHSSPPIRTNGKELESVVSEVMEKFVQRLEAKIDVIEKQLLCPDAAKKMEIDSTKANDEKVIDEMISKHIQKAINVSRTENENETKVAKLTEKVQQLEENIEIVVKALSDIVLKGDQFAHKHKVAELEKRVDLLTSRLPISFLMNS